MAGKTTLIKAKVLYDGKSKTENRFIAIEGDKIADVSASSQAKADYEGWVTPAFIDAHSHIGMFREGEPSEEAEGNDSGSHILPLADPLNSIYFDDRAFKDAVDFGHLYSCVVPGSGNLVGGRARIIRNYADNRKDALLRDYGFKMALGFNPRSTTEWKGERPDTRMGVYQLLEKRFDDVLAKKAKADLAHEKKLRDLKKTAAEKKLTVKEIETEEKTAALERELELSTEDKALVELLSGTKTVKIHVHKEDDVLYLIDFVKRYGIKATADHCGDVHHKAIFDELAKAGIPVVAGPLGSLAYKVELKHEDYRNVGELMRSKAAYGLMTDHPVILSYQLRDSLKYFLVQGMSDADAIGIVTKRNAEILGIDDILGTVEKGKLASVVVWDRDPLSLGAYPLAVYAEGKQVRKGL